MRVVVTVAGFDRPGIVAGIAQALASLNANIVKARASSLLSLFVMVMLVDASRLKVPLRVMEDVLKDRGNEIGVAVSIEAEEDFLKERRLVAIDADGTLVDGEVIDELAKEAGVWEQVREVTEMAMEGRLSFREALERRVALLKGLPVERVVKAASRLKIVPGAREMMEELKRAGFITVLITGGFDVVAEELGRKLGFDYVFANRLVVKDGVLTGEVEGEVMGPEDKLRILREVAEKHGIKLEECVAIGDGANDLLIIRNAGLGVGFNPKEVVRRQAKALVNIKDMRAVLAIIGVGSLGEEIRAKVEGEKKRLEPALRERALGLSA
ncbi:MAG: phosphoserine phosphatase SerB [Candidatus Nezhaarchaeota archaeon]|nr:phosphoserine phosphatase SerB [Candidatus Nezhaarchaeota archaeon]